MSYLSNTHHNVNSALEGAEPSALVPPLLASRLVNEEPPLQNPFELCSNKPGMSMVLAIDPVPSSSIDQNPAIRPKIGGNPQATLMGLPAEIRLEILDHLYPSRLTHVSITGGIRLEGVAPLLVPVHIDGKGVLPRYRGVFFKSIWPELPFRLFWRPCLCPDLNSMTCSRPVWLGTCPTEDTCSTTNDIFRYDFGIARTCKALRNEVRHKVLAHVSMPGCDAETILKNLSAAMLESIQHLVLAPTAYYDNDEWTNRDATLLSVHRLTTTHQLASLRSVTMQRRSLTRFVEGLPEGTQVQIHHKQNLDERICSDEDIADRERATNWFTKLVNDERLPDQFNFALSMEYWLALHPGSSFGFHNDTDEIEMLCVRASIPKPDGIPQDEKSAKVVESVRSSRHRVVGSEQYARWKYFCELQRYYNLRAR